MWKRLAALAALAIAPCAFAQVSSPPAPLTLDEAVSRVARTHPDLRLPVLQRAAAEARYEGAGFKPPLVFGVDVENALGTGVNRGFDASEVTVSLAGVLERGGKLDARRALAQANIDAIAPQREVTRLDLMAEVARRYLAVTAARGQRRIAMDDIEQRRRAVAAARVRMLAGASPASTLMTAQAALAQAELDRDRAEQAERAARMALAALWNAREADFTEVSGEPLQLPALEDFQQLATLLSDTPELAVIAGEARVREAQLQLARSELRGNLSWQMGVRNSRASGDNGLVGGFSMPLGTARRAGPEIRAAETELAMSAVQRESRALQLYSTLAEAHGRYGTARLEVARMGSDVLPQLQRAEKAAETAWRAGAISYMEWGQLQAMRIEARQRQLDAALAAQTALIEIQRLTGQPLVATASEGNTP
ncbi:MULTISPECIES: TolC family protein [Stenotrophomonas]|jgi:cobalt-zinc-cadmium efflux system outer membrane protein|uniref:TolC family protein n=1 Tax=Stenotrophomonas TaxID=40323 RepID=UPI0007028B90|nr:MULTISPECIES: TolC family protein [Stenotrophomonas]KRG87048.1 cation transporter [Stenotrophomonas acidaminiphila]MCA7023720.1 TolC family protein [Stenotrophomonas acidaminiphila]MCE4074281.1 TolC family protein [Stenotrophomonas acidaminiphila]QOF98478.1 TolC family protein [Stenotrophomonas sp. CW117]WHL18746.1 TolC family protein [Stenotrophomonas acidaminiphila]